MKLYIKVLCKDRLPDETGYYYTPLGEKWFFAGYWYLFPDPTERNIIEPEYWFEEISIPTGDEVHKASTERFKDFFDEEDDFPMWDIGFSHCARWLISKLK